MDEKIAEQWRRKPKRCAYCGVVVQKNDNTRDDYETRDHVLPTTLYLRPLPDNMITVPACHACNNELSHHEDYLRDFLVMDIAASGNRTAMALLTTAVRSSIGQKSSDLWKAFQAHGRWEVMRTPGGLHLGHVQTAPVESERINHVLRMMVRGLFYYHRERMHYPLEERRLDAVVFDVRRVYPWSVAELWESWLESGANGPYGQGADVFRCLYFYGLEDPAVTLWLLRFYGGVVFIVSTGPVTEAESA